LPDPAHQSREQPQRNNDDADLWSQLWRIRLSELADYRQTMDTATFLNATAKNPVGMWVKPKVNTGCTKKERNRL
jgi:hypothetical protein